MQPQENFGNPGLREQFCAQCGSPMPTEMRFCRSCGNRLGEGPAEYTETVPFPGSTAQNRGGQTTPFYPTFNAPMTPVTPVCARRRRMGFAGTTWLWILLVAFFGIGGLMSMVRSPRIPREAFGAFADRNRSWVGVNQFDSTDGGVTFKNIDTPGGPADKAGLVGGDIITSFDGQPVRQANEMMDLLRRTQIGKTVEVVYLRDGISHTTQLTTVNADEAARLGREYSRRPEGKGKFGFLPSRTKRVDNGVRIDWLETNGPAELFGIKRGDVITDFDNVPIRTPDELYERVQRAIPYTTVNITLLRDGQKMVIPIKVGKN